MNFRIKLDYKLVTNEINQIAVFKANRLLVSVKVMYSYGYIFR